MVSTFLKCHFKVECLITYSFSAMYISSSFPQHKHANITHSRLIYYFYSTRCCMGLATLVMLLSIVTLHLVLDDANACNEFTGTSGEYFIPYLFLKNLPYSLLFSTSHVISLISLIPLHFQNVQL